MYVIADTHVHMYAVHDFGRLLDGACASMKALVPEQGRSSDAARLLFLTEAEGDDVWQEWAQEGGAVRDTAWTAAPTSESQALVLTHPEHGKLWLFAGRQIVTRERLEVLALTVHHSFKNGQPIHSVIEQITDAGGIPVVPWSPGKWWGRRGKVIASVLDRYAPEDLLVGDILMRPRCGGEPRLMKRARCAGHKIVAGSDPLPMTGEERWVGRYVSCGDVSFDPARPVSSIRTVLRDPAAHFVAVGPRNRCWETVSRLFALRRMQK